MPPFDVAVAVAVASAHKSFNHQWHIDNANALAVGCWLPLGRMSYQMHFLHNPLSPLLIFHFPFPNHFIFLFAFFSLTFGKRVRLRHKINAIYLQNVPLKSHNQAVKMKKEMVRNEQIAESDMREREGSKERQGYAHKAI